MLPNHVMGNSWGPIEYRETGLYNFDQKLPSIDVVKSMSCFSDFNHNTTFKVTSLALKFRLFNQHISRCTAYNKLFEVSACSILYIT